MIGALTVVALLTFTTPASTDVDTAIVGKTIKTAHEASHPTDVVKGVTSLIDAARAGSWIGIASAIIMILLNLFRLPALGDLWHKIPRRIKIVIPVILGGAAGILAMIAGGLPWYEALWIGLLTGPGAVFTHEAIWNAILGKRIHAIERNAREHTDSQTEGVDQADQ